MARKGKRLFSAERKILAQRHTDTNLGDVIDAIQSLEDSISRKVSQQIQELSEKLDTGAEDESKASVDDLMAEIHAMNEHIETTKQLIASLKPADDSDTPISTATNELGEVVKTTEEAANTILGNAEQIEEIVARLRENISQGDPDEWVLNIDKLEIIGIELMTACGFQDITGQRITKVVNALNYIEERLQKMIEIWRIEHGTADLQEMALPKDDDRQDKDLLHGPQSEAGMNQDDIDALFD